MHNDKFCVRPFVHSLVDPNGNLRPCCRINELSGHNINQHSVDEWWNSDYINNIRNKFLRGEQPSECWRCWRQEEQGADSFRKDSNRQWAWRPGDDMPDSPLDWELHTTNVCNLKCMMCNPNSSSQLLIEDKILFNPKLDQRKFNWNPSVKDTLADILESGESFVLRGGEPLLMPWLKDLVRNVSSPKEFLIITNVTRFDQEWVDILSRHKIKMCLSIDAYRDLNHYIRFPSDWQSIVDNIKLIRQIPNVNTFLNTCVQNLNILHLDRLLEWAINEEDLYVHLDVLTKPPIHEPRNLPIELVKEAQRKLVQVKSRLKPKMVDGLDNIIGMLDSNDTTHWQEFVDVVKKRDAYRKLNIIDYLPELKPYFDS